MIQQSADRRRAAAPDYHFPARPIYRLSQTPSVGDVPTPSALIVTIPKSGTIFLNNTLSRALGLASMVISNSHFPEDQLRLDEFREFAKGGRICNAHLDPSPINLQMLDLFIPRWIVHLRDPRSVVLSWTHHLDRLFREGRGIETLHVAPRPPETYDGYGFEDRISWQIDHFAPTVIDWMSAWLGFADLNPSRILVTEFQAMAADETAFIARIADFLDIPFHAAGHQPLEKTMENAHFRSGKTDEWRSSLTPYQIDRISRMIPGYMAERFGWTSA